MYIFFLFVTNTSINLTTIRRMFAIGASIYIIRLNLNQFLAKTNTYDNNKF